MDLTDDTTSRLARDWNPDDEHPDRTHPVKTQGFFRTWFASSADLRSTVDTNDVQWGIYWFTPASVILLFLLGTLAAIAHHIFYNALHHTLVGNEARQQWTMWIGSSLSFFTKVTLTAALGISRTQWVWLTLRKKWLTLRDIDAVFGVTSDPTYFINTIMLKRAKVATIMAIAMWMIPIAAILTSGTISVGRFPRIDNIPCSVRSLRFPFDHNSTATMLADSSHVKNLLFLKMGIWYIDPAVNPANPVVGVVATATRVFKLSAYSGSISRSIDLLPVGLPNVIVTTLGEKCGTNCTYTVEFLGPSVTCTRFTSWSTVHWHNVSQFMSKNNYYASTVSNWSDPILVGFLPSETAMSPIVFQCRSSTTRYTVQQVIVEHSFLEPTITKTEPIMLSDFQDTAIYPDTTYLAQASLMKAFSGLLSGSYLIGHPVTTEITLIPFFYDIFSNRIDLGSTLEQMAHKMVVSLLASDIHWKGIVSTLDVSATQQTICTTTNYDVLYVYSARTLIIAYGFAVACALVTTVAGFFALGQNGMASTKTPSNMIRTTRNPTLDECIVGQNTLGGDTMTDELKKLELRFGALGTGGKGTAHFALGVRGEIYPIKRD